MLNKLRRNPKQEDSFDFSLDAATVPLSIDSIRQLHSGDAADFVEEKILPNAEKTMAVLTDREQTAARLLLSALIATTHNSFPKKMSVLITFIKLIAVFDLLVIAVYFGGDISFSMLNKLRRKPKQEDSLISPRCSMTVSLSIDSIRQLFPATRQILWKIRFCQMRRKRWLF